MESGGNRTRTVKIGGRDFELAFTLRTMLMMQENIEGFDFNSIDRLVATPKGMLDVLYILAENGAKLAGHELDVDKEWFAMHIPPTTRKMVAIQLAIIGALTDGMNMEAEEDDEAGREVDLVLKEIQKKSGKTG